MTGAQRCPRCHRTADAGGGPGCDCTAGVLPRPVNRPSSGPDPADLALFGLGPDTASAPAQGPDAGRQAQPHPQAQPSAPAQQQTQPQAQPPQHAQAEPQPHAQQQPERQAPPRAAAAGHTDGEGETVSMPVPMPASAPAPVPAPAAETRDDNDDNNDATPERPVSHRRPTGPGRTALAAAAAVAAVVGSAALVSGLLAGSGDRADDARPDNRSGPTAALPTGDGTAPPSTVSPSPSGSGKAKASRPSSSSSPSPLRTTAAVGSTSSGKAADGNDSPQSSQSDEVLSLGDSGASVVELQLRLVRISLYKGRADGVYDWDVRKAVTKFQNQYKVQGDPTGVYGLQTRRALESRT